MDLALYPFGVLIIFAGLALPLSSVGSRQSGSRGLVVLLLRPLPIVIGSRRLFFLLVPILFILLFVLLIPVFVA